MIGSWIGSGASWRCPGGPARDRADRGPPAERRPPTVRRAPRAPSPTLLPGHGAR